MTPQNPLPRRPIKPLNPFIRFKDDEIEQSIPERFEQQVRAHGDRLAIKSDEMSFTYDGLNQVANRLARKILALRGDRVEAIALIFDHRASVLAAMLGVLKTGKFYLVLDPSYPHDRLAYMLTDSGADLVITDTKNLPLVAHLSEGMKEVVNLDQLDDTLASDNLELNLLPNALAMLLYTSGSTGQPKGVMHSHQNVLVEVRNLTNAWCISKHDRWLLYTSMSFANSVRTIYGAFLNGGSVYPYDLKERGFGQLPDWLLSNKITLMRSLPTTFRNFMDTVPAEQKFSDIRILSVGGEPVTRSDVEFFNQHFSPPCVLVHGLGPTECFTVCWNYVPHGTRLEESKLAIGYPLRDKQVLLLDDSEGEVPSGEIGEICVKSRYVSLGYWRDPERTKAVFLADPLGGATRIYRTGDLGVRAKNGCLTHVGRYDFQMKIRGFRIDATEIEGALRAIDGVTDAVVIGRDNANGEKRLIGYFVPTTSSAVTVTQIRNGLARLLPDYMIPSTFVRLDAIPKTPNGKADRLNLPLPSRERPELDTPFASPETLADKKLAQIWAEVLDLEELGIHDNFFDLGGDSLLASRVISRVIREFRVELPLRFLFETPTVAEVANAIANYQGNKLGEAELEQILTDLESLSDHEAERLVAGSLMRMNG